MQRKRVRVASADDEHDAADGDAVDYENDVDDNEDDDDDEDDDEDVDNGFDKL